MRKVKLYIAVSIDGFIARPDGNLDWLVAHNNSDALDYGYKEFYDSVDILIMGRQTYDSVLNMDMPWPYDGKETYIVTHKKQAEIIDPNVCCISDDIIEVTNELKKTEGKDIWLIGGGQIISLFLIHDLVDEITLFYIPTIIGDGIRLFPGTTKDSLWETIDCKKYSTGVMQIDYRRTKL